MKDPIRLLDDASDADALERAVLGAGFEPPPEKSTEDQILARILASAALVPATVAVDHGLKTAGAVKTSIALGVVKGFAVGMAIYGAASGVRALAPHAEAARTTTAKPTHSIASSSAAPSSSNVVAQEIIPEPVLALSARPSAPSAPATVNTAGAAALPATTPSPSVPAVATFAEDRPAEIHVRASELEAEARSLRDAHAALRAGQLARARTLLEESAARFSSPALYQEREALMIELLDRDGQVSEARQRAHIFLERFPESPHAARVKQLVQSP
jgi:hypothetical protein